MSRALSFAVFFGVMLTLTGLVHYYVWARLVRDVGLGVPATRALTAVIVLLYLTIPGTFLLSRVLEIGLGRAVLWVAFSWLGMLLLFSVVLVSLDLVRGAWWLGARVLGQDEAADPERRRFLARVFALAALAVAGGLGAAALRSGLGRVAMREVRVRLERLPSELDGLSIVQLSDVHVGPTIGRAFVEELVRRTNELEPDVIAITGDLVDGSVEELRAAVAPLAGLRARYGVYFVTGNHEYYSGARAWCEELTRLGMRVLRNERVAIGSGEASFDLAGVDDFSSAGFGDGHGPNLEKALDGRDDRRELVLLAHQPRAIFEAQERGVGLQLSGHTHGGQIWPWSFFVRLQQPVVSGLKRFGPSFVYVSNGTGYWGPPMRLGAPAEITKVVLLAPAEAVA